jgi:hypothetical protein
MPKAPKKVLKVPKCYSLDDETLRLVDKLIESLGDTASAIIRRAVRLLAKSENIK